MTGRGAQPTIDVVPRSATRPDAGPRGSESTHRPGRSDPVEALVTRYLPLASNLARHYMGRGEDIDDLVQVANLGLVKAARRYDVGRGACFVTYATHTINGELRRYFRDHAWTLHVPRSAKERAVLVAATLRRERERTGMDLSSSELASRLDLSERDVADARETWRAYRPESIDASPALEPDADLPRLSDRLGELDTEYARVNGRVTRLVTMREISSLQRRILYMRYVEDRTQREIAAQGGLSPNRVSRLLLATRKQLDLLAA
jgi:RNA polymerase sigma-B factor